MKKRILYIAALFIVFSINDLKSQDESKRADTSLTKSKLASNKTTSIQNDNSDSKLNEESRSSGISKPSPVIIYRDEEKIMVQPKKQF